MSDATAAGPKGGTWDQQMVLANLYAVARASLRAADAKAHRAYLEALADFAHDEGPAQGGEPGADSVLGEGVGDKSAARRLAARLRGMCLGAAAHTDTARNEVVALAKVAAGGEGVGDEALAARAVRAWEAARAELERDVVRLGAIEAPKEAGELGWLRRWGVVRWLELNGFIAAFTRDGTHAGATKATSAGRDAGALRFAMAVSQAAMAFAHEEGPEPGLLEDARAVEAALAPLLANVVSTAKGA